MSLPIVTLKPGKEASLYRRHPWLFSGALATEPTVRHGGLVSVVAANGHVFGIGAHNAHSQIRVRMYRFGDGAVDRDWLADRLRRALQLRDELFGAGWTVGRLLFGESDGLPGFVVDRYEDTLSVQISTAGAEALREEFLAALDEVLPLPHLVERSDVGERAKEGLDERKVVLRGDGNRTFPVSFPSGLRLEVNPFAGQKTGMYLDQVQNWERVARFAAGRSVLDCHSYTGGFGLSAGLRGAASVEFVDSSKRAIEAVGRNIALNGLSIPHTLHHAEVTPFLLEAKAAGKRWGLIVLDPPPLAKKQKDLKDSQKVLASMVRAGLDCLEPGGLLAMFTCSGAITPEVLHGQVLTGALRSGLEVQFLEELGASPDHPVTSAFPESRYLNGYLLRALPR